MMAEAIVTSAAIATVRTTTCTFAASRSCSYVDSVNSWTMTPEKSSSE